jgi:hypothetical protein
VIESGCDLYTRAFDATIGNIISKFDSELENNAALKTYGLTIAFGTITGAAFGSCFPTALTMGGSPSTLGGVLTGAMIGGCGLPILYTGCCLLAKGAETISKDMHRNIENLEFFGLI